MFNRITFAIFLCLSALALGAQIELELESFADGFNSPVDITNAGDERLFVVEKNGRIRLVLADGTVSATPFLDIAGRVNSAANERGLLGLCFHPVFPDSPYCYVNYTGIDGNTRISRFSLEPGNNNQADPGSERVLLTVAQPASNHNAGDLAFGPDGFLYFGLGDGGSAGDPWNNAQDPSELLGKLLRIDVDHGSPYSIPADNPFTDRPSYRPEIWAMGLRNPWRISFDRLNGNLWIGDVGQNTWEEIDLQPASSGGGENYGWRCYEGFEPFNTGGCPSADSLTKPVHVYSNSFGLGCSVTGGFVYRGCNYPQLFGRYLYADYCTGNIWSLEEGPDGNWVNSIHLNFQDQQLVSFGEDFEGELYAVAIQSGSVYRLIDNKLVFELEEITFTDSSLLVPAGLGSYQWFRNGNPIPSANEPELTNLQPGSYTVLVTSSSGCTLEAGPFEILSSIRSIRETRPVIHPNPAKEYLLIRFPVHTEVPVRMQLQDVRGRVRKEIRPGAGNEFSMKVDRLEPGLYFFLLFYHDGRRATRKVLLIH